MKSTASVTDSQYEILYLDCRWFSGRRYALFASVQFRFSGSVQENRQPSLKPRVTSEEGKI